MTNSFSKGATVRWNWGGGMAEGKVAERFERRVQRTIEGARIVRRGADNPAYLVKQEDGRQALKLGSELTGA